MKFEENFVIVPPSIQNFFVPPCRGKSCSPLAESRRSPPLPPNPTPTYDLRYCKTIDPRWSKKWLITQSALVLQVRKIICNFENIQQQQYSANKKAGQEETHSKKIIIFNYFSHIREKTPETRNSPDSDRRRARLGPRTAPAARISPPPPPRSSRSRRPRRGR